MGSFGAALACGGHPACRVALQQPLTVLLLRTASVCAPPPGAHQPAAAQCPCCAAEHLSSSRYTYGPASPAASSASPLPPRRVWPAKFAAWASRQATPSSLPWRLAAMPPATQWRRWPGAPASGGVPSPASTAHFSTPQSWSTPRQRFREWRQQGTWHAGRASCIRCAAAAEAELSQRPCAILMMHEQPHPSTHPITYISSTGTPALLTNAHTCPAGPWKILSRRQWSWAWERARPSSPWIGGPLPLPGGRQVASGASPCFQPCALRIRAQPAAGAGLWPAAGGPAVYAARRCARIALPG